MRARRSHIGLKTKLAAALCQMLRPNERGVLVPVIGHEESRQLTADEIISRFHFDHFPIPHAEGGPDLPWNLTPLPKAEHQVKTAKVDIPRIAKNKRVARAAADHSAVMLAKATGEAKPAPKKRKAKIPGRPLTKGRRFQSRAQA